MFESISQEGIMASVNEEIDHEFLKGVFDRVHALSYDKLSMKKLEDLLNDVMKAKRMLEGWEKEHDPTDPHLGNIRAWEEEVKNGMEAVKNRISADKNAKKAGRRRRHHHKRKTVRKVRKVRRTRKH